MEKLYIFFIYTSSIQNLISFIHVIEKKTAHHNILYSLTINFIAMHTKLMCIFSI